VAESFFSSLKTELTDGASYHSQADASPQSVSTSRRSTKLVRRHSYLDYHSPIQFELKNQDGRIRGIIRLSAESGQA
jgi:putative transposase